jgi:hypothetical protein
MDYLKKFDELRERMRRKAEETDRRYGIRTRLDDATRAAEAALRKAEEVAREGVDAARHKAEEFDRDGTVRDRARETASNVTAAASDAARAAADALFTGAHHAGEQASDFFGEAKGYYQAAAGAVSRSATAATAAASIMGTISSARTWIKENPGKATVVTLSLIAGARAGTAWPSLDVTILGAGASGHWFFHSAIASYGMYRLSDKYMAFLKERERMLAEGRLTEAERARVEFQRNAAKYVGAPLLGAFSVAAGATLMYEAFTGGAVVGFPVNLILGGNPLLSSIWLFGNGVVCFHNGYKFFMMALANEEDVQRVMRELRGLLPAANIA